MPSWPHRAGPAAGLPGALGLASATPKASPLCLLVGRPCRYCGCPEWLLPTVMVDGECFAVLVGTARVWVCVCPECGTTATLDMAEARFFSGRG
jgi:hypothetical protein